MITHYKTDWVKHTDHFFHHFYLSGEDYGVIYFTLLTKGSSKQYKLRTIRCEKKVNFSLRHYIYFHMKKYSHLVEEAIRKFEPPVRMTLNDISLVDIFPGERRIKGKAMYTMPGDRIVFELIQTDEKRTITINIKKNQIQRLEKYLYPGWKNELKTRAAKFLQTEIRECKAYAPYGATALEVH